MSKARRKVRQATLAGSAAHPNAPLRLAEALSVPIPARTMPLWEEPADLAQHLSRAIVDTGLLLDRQHGDGAAVARLALVSALAQTLDGNLRELVVEARAEGASWAKIGAALNVSRQAAYERFSGVGGPADG